MLLSLLKYKNNCLPKHRVIYHKKEAKIVVWKITETESELIQMLQEPAISDGILDRKSETNRKQFLASRILLKEEGLLHEIEKNENGKPFIPNNHISITHDTDYVAIMISKNSCGIDLQSISEKVFKIKHKFIDNDDVLLDLDELISLTISWSLKEAIYKIFGDPLLYFKEHIRIRKMDINTIYVDILHPKYLRSVLLKVQKIDQLYLTYTV